MSRRTPEGELRDLARLLLRSGLLTFEQARGELVEAIARDLPRRDAGTCADQWLGEARDALLAEQASWPAATDHDALTAVFAACEAAGVRVLPGVADHWNAKEELDRLGASPPSERVRGIVWFTHPDVWHAIDHGMLEVNLWHGDTANAAPGDPLLADVLAIFARHGLDAHFDEGRIEVAAHWQRRL